MTDRHKMLRPVQIVVNINEDSRAKSHFETFSCKLCLHHLHDPAMESLDGTESGDLVYIRLIMSRIEGFTSESFIKTH